jgi:hypothetical protein
MTIKRKNNLWIPPTLSSCGYKITLTGGGFEKYFIPKDLYSDNLLLCSHTHTGYMYPFDPESKPKQQHIPTFYGKEREYTNIGCFQITQYVYVFKLGGPAKKAFNSVKKEYEKQLEAYKSMKDDYYTKKIECFCNRWKKKERRKYKVCSIPEKASRRDYELKKLSEKVSS